MQPQLDSDIVKLLEKGKYIEALKRLRARTNLGLAEAKAIVEAFQKSRGQMPDIRTQAEALRSQAQTVATAVKTHAQQHQFSHVPEQTPAQTHVLQERYGLGPGEVPAPSYQVVKAAAFFMLMAAALWFLLQ